MRLADKVTIITGSGGGMGRVAARIFAGHGAKVVVAEYGEGAGQETVDLIRGEGGEATFVKVDVSNESNAMAMVDHAVVTYGRLDCLYNNAGIMPEADHSVTDTAVDVWDQVMAVNVRGVFLGCKYAIPAMEATGGGLAARGAVHAADHVDDAVGGIRWMQDAARAACSFTPETLVATPDGPVPIASIEVADTVLAWDKSTGQVVERTVTAVLPHPDDEIARVTINGIVLTTTPDHPFYTIERGWVEAGLLWPGAHVKTTTGSGVVGPIATAPYSGILWDLTVAGAHTFFVGSGEWLVHNECWVNSHPASQMERRGWCE